MTGARLIRHGDTDFVVWTDGSGLAEVWRITPGMRNPSPDKVVRPKGRPDVSELLTHSEMKVKS